MRCAGRSALRRTAGAASVWAAGCWIVVDALRGPTPAPGILLAVAWAVAASRRLAAPVALAVPVTVTLIAVGTGVFPNDSASTMLALGAAAFLFGRRATLRVVVPGALAWLVACVVLAPLYDPLDPAGATDLLYPLLWMGIALGVGAALRHADATARRLGAAVAVVRADLDDERARALDSERRRIATELNDVVVQAVGAMQIEASAALAALEAGRPAPAERALTTLEEAGRAALDDLRRMLNVLRDAGPAEPLVAVRGLADALALRPATSRLEVTSALDAVDALPPGLDLTAGRVVARLLAAVAAAGGERADVRAVLRGGQLHLEVTHDAPVSDPLQVVGVRERVDLYGGRLLAAGDGGRWAATLPVSGDLAHGGASDVAPTAPTRVVAP